MSTSFYPQSPQDDDDTASNDPQSRLVRIHDGLKIDLLENKISIR